MMAMTVPTAVMNREVLLARAQVDAHFARGGQPMSGAPTPKERLDPVPSTDPEQALSSTLDEGGPAVKPPPDSNEFNDDVATIVTKSPLESGDPYTELMNNHATLQVAEVPPEIQALRAKMYPGAVQPRTLDMPPPPPPPPPPAPIPTAPPPSPMIHMARHEPPPQSMPPSMPQPMPPSFIPSAPIPAPPKKGIPAWLFWTFLVISFCFAGGVAAALLTHFVQ
jgi:hypothetical protein